MAYINGNDVYLNADITSGEGTLITDYNDLTNKPFTYLDHAALDELTEKGMYVTDSFDWYENGEYSGSYQSQAIIIIDTNPYMSNFVSQVVWLPHGGFSRTRQNGEWGAMQQITYQTGSNTEQIFNIPDMGETPHEITLETNKKYRAEINRDCAFILPTVSPIITEVWSDNSILVYAHFTEAVSVDWGSDVMFYNGEVPTITAGYFDIIFTFDPNAQKWCVGVINKGAAA